VEVGLIAVIMLIECIDHCMTFCKETQDTRLMFCEEIYTGRNLRAYREDTAESWDCFQLLFCHNCGRRKFPPCTQMFPDRQASQTISEKYRKKCRGIGRTARQILAEKESEERSPAT
jgi:hypothetical protein